MERNQADEQQLRIGGLMSPRYGTGTPDIAPDEAPPVLTRRPEIGEQVERLQINNQMLIEAVQRLEKRLSIVMCEQTTHGRVEEKKKTDREPATSLGRALYEIGNTQGATLMVLKRIEDLLEI